MSQVEVVAPGITFLSTPGHGYWLLSAERQRKMPTCLRLPEGKYEEDVEWARVALVFPDCFKGNLVVHARRILKDHHPDAYSELTGEIVSPEESWVLRQRLFREEHQDDYVAVSAYGSHHPKVPAGWVGVLAGRGGRLEDGRYPEDVAYFLVPEKEYETRGEFGYVINRKTCLFWNGPGS